MKEKYLEIEEAAEDVKTQVGHKITPKSKTVSKHVLLILRCSKRHSLWVQLVHFSPEVKNIYLHGSVSVSLYPVIFVKVSLI